MEKNGFISLTSRNIRSYHNLEKQLGRTISERFKAITENGCIPLHIRGKEESAKPIHIFLHDGNKRYIELGAGIRSIAKEIVKRENQSLADKGITGPWIDGEKLALTSLTTFSNALAITTSIMKFSQILAMRDFSFDDIALHSAFKLDTNTHVLAKDGNHTVLLVGQRGKKPGEPRMGSDALCAPVGSEIQWTLATNGILDADVLHSTTPEDAWIKNSFKEFKEELGVETGSLKYLGMMVDPIKFIGAFGILGIIKTYLSPEKIEEARKRARDSIEVPVLDVIPLEKESIATYLRVNQSNMVPQLITGLAILGFQTWGEEFLILADK